MIIYFSLIGKSFFSLFGLSGQFSGDGFKPLDFHDLKPVFSDFLLFYD